LEIDQYLRYDLIKRLSRLTHFDTRHQTHGTLNQNVLLRRKHEIKLNKHQNIYGCCCPSTWKSVLNMIENHKLCIKMENDAGSVVLWHTSHRVVFVENQMLCWLTCQMHIKCKLLDSENLPSFVCKRIKHFPKPGWGIFLEKQRPAWNFFLLSSTPTQRKLSMKSQQTN
jgi:hypothetical protein